MPRAAEPSRSAGAASPDRVAASRDRVAADATLDAVAAAARRRDPAAFTALVHATRSDVVRFVRGVAPSLDAEDVAQEVYARVWRGALEGWTGAVPVRVWTLGIARHVALDEIRAGERRQRLLGRLVGVPARAVRGSSSTVAQPSAAVDPGADPADEVALRAALGRLTPDRRAALLLTAVLGLSYDEAAQVCGCPVGTVRSRVARARADVRAFWEADT